MCFLPKRERVQKLFLPIGATLLCLASSALGQQIYFGYGTDKEFIQSSGSGPKFDGGRFSAILRDGLAIIRAGCAYNGSVDSFGPIVAPGINCPIGGTGMISSGFVFLEGDLDDPDIDNEAILADNTYWQVTTIARAETFEPFQPDLCKLVAAPASSLPRPLSGFEERGVIVFYNMRDIPNVTDFNISRYEFSRPYGSWPVDNGVEVAEGNRMLKEWVPGQYIFQFPSLDRPNIPTNVAVRLYPFVEGYNTSTSAGRQGFKFLGNRWDQNGYFQLDPRLVNTVNWQVSMGGLVRTDKLYFSIEGDDLDPDDDIPARNFIPDGSAVRIANIQATSYKLPPGFFLVGDTGVAKVEYKRSLFITTSASDVSTRSFKMPVRFVDTYPGFATVWGGYKTSTKLKDRDAKADFDKDGFNNVTEFAMESNPSDAIITAITSTPTTFSVTAINHGLTAGDTVTIIGATPAGYNGSWTVASSTTDTFVVNSAANLGAGKGGSARLAVDAPTAITAITPEANPDITDLTFVPSYFIITTAAPHGKVTGQTIVVSGVTPTGYNGIWTASSVTATTIRVNVDTLAGAGTGGSVRAFLPGQLSVFDAEVDMPNYLRTHTGSVIEVHIAKRPDTGTSLSYGIETKADAAAKKWSKVKPGSTWTVILEDENEIVFQSDGTVPLTTWIRPTATSNF